MALGRENVAVARTNSGADVFRLAGFLRDDDLIGHDGLGWKNRFDSGAVRTYSELNGHTSCLLTASRGLLPLVVATGASELRPPRRGHASVRRHDSRVLDRHFS